MSTQKLLDIPVKVEIYDQLSEWEVNTGKDDKIVARRMSGRYRTFKTFSMSVWLIYFLGPYLRWNGQQAVLFDIPNRQFNIFSATIYPQDIWILSLTLLFFAILLAAVTSIAGRVFCGYFCFQTVWTDVFTFIEGKLEGNTPQKATKFKQAPWTPNKISRKITKHGLWLMIALLTGISFSAWFMDAHKLWQQILNFSAPMPVWIVLGVFTSFTYWFAGFMREQVCFWLCPYARLQGVMYDQDTVLPAYDAERGEPRGKLNRNAVETKQGSCIDCKLCVAVCPTGIDIRKGQQEGCITCGLCIDACDSIMDKIAQPRGLIRYASYKELHHDKKQSRLFFRPRFIVYSLIMLLSVSGIIYGFTHLSPTEFTISHERQPLYVRMSDGSIQNKYTLKLLNKTKTPLVINFDIKGLANATLTGMSQHIKIKPGEVLPISAFVRIPQVYVKQGIHPFIFVARAINKPGIQSEQQTMFIAP